MICMNIYKHRIARNFHGTKFVVKINTGPRIIILPTNEATLHLHLHVPAVQAATTTYAQASTYMYK